MNWKSMNLCCGIVTCLVLMVADVHGIMFHLEPNGRKCLREELQAQTLVSGDYHVADIPGQRVDVSVKDTKGQILAQKDDIPHGKPWKFSFITDTYDTYEVCFISHIPQHQRGMKQEITLTLKHGVEAKSYEAIGEAAKLKPIEVELKRLEDLSQAIVHDFARMRQNEEQMRDTNETTNARVLYFSIFSMCCLLGLATWQVFYLRRFFRAKKLIE